MIFEEDRWEVLGMPSAMKLENLEKGKASNKWFKFHEDFGHVTDYCMSLKMRVDNHLQRGELTKYKKEPISSSMVEIAPPYPIKYINAIFARVDVVTKGQL